MMIDSISRAAYAPMTFFVLLWGSAPIFTRWGLDHGSPLALLILRFTLALGVLAMLGFSRRRWLPVRGTRRHVALTGLLLTGGYSVCYFQTLAHGITPGLLATLMGIQPLLTLLLIERRFAFWRLVGLCLALGGLALVVLQSLLVASFSTTGMLFAFGALVCMTVGAIWQKSIQQPPGEVMPLQYMVTLALLVLLTPWQSVSLEWSPALIVPVLWLGVVISVVAQLLLYRMIRSGNLVNVTSLLYLVPIVTALLDYLLLGNALSPAAMIGMVAILGGVALVFRSSPA